MNATINLLFLGIILCAPFNDCFSIKLTLPFEQSDSSITCDFNCYYFKDGSPHGGIDYQFPNGLKSKGHPIVASASGFAVAIPFSDNPKLFIPGKLYPPKNNTTKIQAETKILMYSPKRNNANFIELYSV